MDALITLFSIIIYCIIARGVFAYLNKIQGDDFMTFMSSLCWPTAIIYYFVLRYPFGVSSRLGEKLADWQSERKTKRLRKRAQIRQQLEESNRQAEQYLAEAERELEASRHSLEQQFAELERQQSKRASA